MKKRMPVKKRRAGHESLRLARLVGSKLEERSLKGEIYSVSFKYIEHCKLHSCSHARVYGNISNLLLFSLVLKRFQ